MTAQPGTPTPLVFLPGMMCDARLFAPQLAHFSSSRAVMVAPLNGADTITGLAEAVLRAAPPRFALAGLSMGGIVAMEMARLAPDRLDRIALLDTNPLAEDPERARLRETQIKRALAGELRDILRDDMKPHYLSDGPNRAALRDLCMAMGESLGPEIFTRQSRALRDRLDQSASLSRIACPALVLCGQDDSLCPPARHALMRDLIPDAVWVLIEGAGHLPTLENPQATNRALSVWLDRMPQTKT